MKSKFLILTGVFVFSSAFAVAGPATASDELQASILAKAAESKNGVIMAITPRGKVAADAAYLLSNQMPYNPGYAPLLMAVDKDKLKGYLGELKLSNEDLPALVFFNKSGKELGRVVAAQTTMLKLKQMQAAKVD
jgi:hypothetical protein